MGSSMTRKGKRGFGVGASAALLAAGCWSVVVACSDDEPRVTFTADDASDATTTPGLDGTFVEKDGGACRPAAPAKPLTTKPPERFQPGACTTAQIDGYVKECLQSDGKACETYKSANGSCVACVESTSADTTWGPIVFYENRRFYDYNNGGCIANVTGDFGDAACGAARTRYLECRHAACVGCLPDGFPLDYAPFFACQEAKATDTLCATELSDMNGACAAYFASKPDDPCQGAGLSADDYLRKLIRGWCGGVAPDAGGDGGDGGDGG